MVVQHNLQAMNANRMLLKTTSSQAKSTEKLSSGYKINRAADDAAGLAISEKMRKQMRGLDRASTNAQDGISMVQTAEGALNEVHDMLQRMNELAIKAANGTNSESDRQAIQDEIDQLLLEVNRVGETTKFNEIYVLKGRYRTGVEADYYQGKLPENVLDDSGNALKTSHKLEQMNMTDIGAEKFVNCNGGSYNSTGNYYTGKVDLSSITTKKQVEDLYGTGVSATCCAGCGQFYSVKFVDNSPELNLNNDGYKVVSNSTGGVNLWVDISGSENGSDIVRTVMTAYGKYNGEDYDVNHPQAYSMNNSHHVAISGNINDATLFLFESNQRSSPVANPIEENDFRSYGAFQNGYVSKIADVILENPRVNIHSGSDANMSNKISVELPYVNDIALGLSRYEINWKTDEMVFKNYADVTTEDNATRAITVFGEAIDKLSEMRSKLGAYQNRLEHTISNLDNIVENTTAAESRIRDTDMAEEMVEYSKNNILAQAGQSMLAQANQSSQGVMALLR